MNSTLLSTWYSTVNTFIAQMIPCIPYKAPLFAKHRHCTSADNHKGSHKGASLLLKLDTSWMHFRTKIHNYAPLVHQVYGNIKRTILILNVHFIWWSTWLRTTEANFWMIHFISWSTWCKSLKQNCWMVHFTWWSTWWMVGSKVNFVLHFCIRWAT